MSTQKQKIIPGRRKKGQQDSNTRNNTPTEHPAFSLTLCRTVKVKRYPVMARIISLQERADIASLLESIQSAPERIPPRLTEYLHHEQLWDKDSAQLTPKGLQVLKTKQHEIRERGLYHIWYTHNDELLGTRPILLQRDTAFNAPAHKIWKRDKDAAYSEFQVKEPLEIRVLDEVYSGQKSVQEQKPFNLIALQPEVICESEQESTLNLVWKIDLNSSDIRLGGKLNKLIFNQNKKPELQPEEINFSFNRYHEHLPKLMQLIADRFPGNWNSTQNRMQCDLTQVKDISQAVQTFLINRHNVDKLHSEFGNYTDVVVQSLPIAPSEEIDAQQWHNFWLRQYHGKGYRSPVEAKYDQARWLDHPAIETYNLPLKEQQSLLDELSREKDSSAYWHIAAMTDLTPAKSKRIHLPVTLVDGETLDLQEHISTLTNQEVVTNMILSDRYVFTRRHSENLEYLADCLPYAEGLLMTMQQEKGQEAELPHEDWKKQFFQKEPNNHGRYWIFITNEDIYCWECSSGIDFMHCTPHGDFVRGTPTFTPKKVDELPQYLQKELQNYRTKEVQ